jgi:hypothetical protein
MAINELTIATKVATAKKIERAPSVTPSYYDTDVLTQFRANLEQVEELTRKLRFVMGEVQQVVAKRRS